MLHTAITLGVRFSVTGRQDKKERAALDAMGDDGWQPIPYPGSTVDLGG